MKRKYLHVAVWVVVVSCGSVSAQISNLTVNGSSTSFAMNSGGVISWSYNVSPAGATTTISVWYDRNGNGVIDTSTDILWRLFTQTDGISAVGNGSPPDMDGVVNGAVFVSMPVGLAPGKYIMQFAQGGKSLTVTGVVNPLSSPAHTISGTVTVPTGKSPQYIFVEAHSSSDNPPRFWDGITDANGNYKIQMDADTSGNPWQVGISTRVYAPSVIIPGERDLNIIGDPSGANFSIVTAAAQVCGVIRDESGNPVAGKEVEANVTNDTATIQYYADADLNGQFQIGVPTADLVSWRNWQVGAYSEGNAGETTNQLDAITQIGPFSAGDSVFKNLTIYNANSTIQGRIEINGSAPGFPMQIVAHNEDTAQAVTWSDASTGNFTLSVTDKISKYQIFPIHYSDNYSVPYVWTHAGSSGIVVNLTATAVNSREPLPQMFSLSQNYPNPFNPSTVIEYQVATLSRVTMKVYNVLGEEVATLVDETKSPGQYSVKFDGSKFPSGVYFYRMNAGAFTAVKKLLLTK